MLEGDLLIERIQLAIKQAGMTVNKALVESGAGKDLIANIKKGQYPSVVKVSLLADCIDVSLDYLVGRSDDPKGGIQ